MLPTWIVLRKKTDYITVQYVKIGIRQRALEIIEIK